MFSYSVFASSCSEVYCCRLSQDTVCLVSVIFVEVVLSLMGSVVDEQGLGLVETSTAADSHRLD